MNKWSRNTPTESGYYWYNPGDWDKSEMIYLDSFYAEMNSGEMWITHPELDSHQSGLASEHNGYWMKIENPKGVNNELD